MKIWRLRLAICTCHNTISVPMVGDAGMLPLTARISFHHVISGMGNVDVAAAIHCHATTG